MLSLPSARTFLFVLLTSGVLATALLLSARLAEMEQASAVALGMTFDLLVLVPCAYYFLVARPRGWSLLAVTPVVLAGLFIATTVLPAEHERVLRVVEVVAIPLEISLVLWAVSRTSRIMRAERLSLGDDTYEVIQATLRRTVQYAPVRNALLSELSVFYFAFMSWRKRPHVPDGGQLFTSHRRSGHGGLVIGLLVLTAAEGVAMHVLLSEWNAPVAWVVTLFSLYGGLWLIADFRATILRPVVLDNSDLWVRAGLRWESRVRRELITAVGMIAPPPGGTARSLTFLSTPNVWVAFAEPVQFVGPYGFRVKAATVGLFVDEPLRLQEELLKAH